MKGEIDNTDVTTIIVLLLLQLLLLLIIVNVGDFNTPLRPMDRSSRQKTNKAIEILKETIEK